MRVLHVVASLAPRHGGPTRAALDMVAALNREGIEASILSSNDDLGDTLDVPCGEWIEHEGARVCFLPRVKARQHTLVGFTWTPGLASWLRTNIAPYDFVHVHTVFSHPANVAMQECRRAGKPYAVRPLGQLCHWSMRQRAWVKKLQLAIRTRQNISGAAFIHTTSAMEARETSGLGFHSPCKVLPHGLDMPPIIENVRSRLRGELGLPDETPVIAFLSRLHEKKGVELLLDACSKLRRDFKLVIAGSGDADYVRHLKHRVGELGIGQQVIWTGFVEGVKKWTLLQGADVFALPSHSENFGIAVLEAVACGLPVVVSDQVALADEITEHRLGRVVPLDRDALVSALDGLLGSPSERDDIHSRAPIIASGYFSWPAAARRLISAYEESVPPSKR